MTAPRSAPKVLLVEDNPTCQQLFGIWLRTDGFDVALASDGPGALDTILRLPFDFVLLDIRLPGLDGLAVARRVRAAGNTVPIIAVTADAFPGDRERCLDAGIDDYVSKPCPRAALFDAIARVFSGR